MTMFLFVFLKHLNGALFRNSRKKFQLSFDFIVKIFIPIPAILHPALYCCGFGWAFEIMLYILFTKASKTQQQPQKKSSIWFVSFVYFLFG